jgi:hypothetical protein
LKKSITVSRATEEIQRLQAYVSLAEGYEANTLEKYIIKEYAFTNSVAEIVKRLERQGILLDGIPIERDYVIKVIKGKSSDPLHRMMKSWLVKKSKQNQGR